MPPSLTLKQRLSALADAQSSASPTHPRSTGRSNNNTGDSYHGPSYRETTTVPIQNDSTHSGFGSTSTLSTKKLKAFASNLQAPSWMTMKRSGGPLQWNGKGHHHHHHHHVHGGGADYASFVRGREEEERQNRLVQEVLGNLIFQAGVDYETRPMVVMNASAFPDPQLVSYDLLLSRILSYLNLYVEADYTVVFLAAGSRHTPSWNWIWKAYRSLSRKYRKNLKQLQKILIYAILVLFSLAGAIISPKFFRKITYVTTLSDLAQHVPLTQIDIPPAAYQENLKYERKITLPIPTRSSVFGVPLADLMGYDGERGSVPRVIKDAAQFLRDSGMEDEGLFRRSPSSVLLRAAQEAYDRGNVVSLETFGDPHLAAVLIKKYLRDLPEPLVPERVYDVIMACPMSPAFFLVGVKDDDDDNDGSAAAEESEREAETVRYIRESILPELVPCASTLLSFILHLLHDVSLRSDANRMNASNLAMMISPNLVKGTNPLRDVMMCSVPLPATTTTATTTGSSASPGSGSGVGATSTSAGTAAATFGDGNGNSSVGGTTRTTRTTLGMVVAFCIARYYEVFDEYVDRSEAVKPWRAFQVFGSEGQGYGGALAAAAALGTGMGERHGHGHGHGSGGTYVLGEDDDDESVLQQDDVKRDMRASPSPLPPPPLPPKSGRQTIGGNGSNAQSASSPPSVFNTTTSTTTGSPSAWNARQHSSSASAVGYMNANGSGGGGATKTRSVISIEPSGASRTDGNTATTTTTVRRGGGGGGSIAIGRRGGSPVVAVGVTAAGFFVPPGTTTTTTTGDSTAGGGEAEGEGEGEEEEGEEEEKLKSVAERRKMFENSPSAG